MIVSLTSEIADLNGMAVFNADESSTLESYSRRITRTATLDGLSIIDDMGYTASDATLNIIIKNCGKVLFSNLSYLIKTHPVTVLSCRTGVYKGVTTNLKLANGSASFNFIVSEKLDDA